LAQKGQLAVRKFMPIHDDVRADLELLTADELCSLLKVKRKWLYVQVQANQIPFARLGRQLRFAPREIEAWLDGRWTPPEAVQDAGADVLPTLGPKRRRGRPRTN
jgi:excisionase family DNA binding protein